MTDILLVEDNPNDAELALYALKKHKIANKVDVVNDGAQALEYVFSEGPYAHRKPTDLPMVILLDLKLPKINGLEVLHRIKSDPRTRTVPVVILTSSREESDVLRSYQLGVNSYIVKPIDFEEFTEAMRQVGTYWLHHNLSPRK